MSSHVPGHAAGPTHVEAAALLGLHGLACERGGRRLFSGVSAQVPGGTLLLVGGRNGAGKTSLLRLVCGLARPADGEVRWRGLPIAAERDRFHAELLYIGHAAGVKDELSARDNLQAAADVAGIACDPRLASDALCALGLRGREQLPARSLSQGQRRRVALARLVLPGPALLWVLDEPFDALDDEAARWLQARIGQQLQRGGIVVLTSHQPRNWDAGIVRQSLRLGEPATAPRAPAEQALAEGAAA